MTFPETIKSLSYEIIENIDNKIQIEKETKYSTFVVIFDMNEKYINACLQPKSLIHSDTDITHLNNDWYDLKQDLSTFKKLSNYDILYPTENNL